MLESLVRDKHLSLLQKFVNYGREKFYKLGPGWCPNRSAVGRYGRLCSSSGILNFIKMAFVRVYFYPIVTFNAHGKV